MPEIDDLRRARDLVLAHGVEPRRVSRGWCLVTREGAHLPPKVVYKRALEEAGEIEEVTGGETACELLQRSGLEGAGPCPCTDNTGAAKAPQSSRKEPSEWELGIGLYMPSGPADLGTTWLRGLKKKALQHLSVVLFPEGFVSTAPTPQSRRAVESQWRRLAKRLQCDFLLGVRVSDAGGSSFEQWLVPCDTREVITYRKHANTCRGALDIEHYDENDALPVFFLGEDQVPAGTTVCHDHYVSPLQRRLVERGARVLFNPSLEPSRAQLAKWRDCQAARALENGAYTFCVQWDCSSEPPHKQVRALNPRLAYGPDGRPLELVRWGDSAPLWTCEIAGPATRRHAPHSGEGDCRLTWRINGQGHLDLTRSEKARKWESGSAFRVGGSFKWKSENGQQERTVELLAHMIDPEVLWSPIACWRRVLLSEHDGEHALWVRCFSKDLNRLKTVARSRVIELCIPVVLDTGHEWTLFGVAKAAKGCIEGKASFKIVSQGCPRMVARNVIGANGGERATRRRWFNFLSALRAWR